MEILGDDEMIIWFIGIYVIFILQQIGLLMAIRTIEKLLYGKEDYKPGETLKKGLDSQRGGKKWNG